VAGGTSTLAGGIGVLGAASAQQPNSNTADTKAISEPSERATIESTSIEIPFQPFIALIVQHQPSGKPTSSFCSESFGLYPLGAIPTKLKIDPDF
jgi:hypothetical protein